MKNNTHGTTPSIKFIFIIGCVVHFIILHTLHAAPQLDEKKLENVLIKFIDRELSLEQAFRIVEQQTDFKFFYMKEDLPLDAHVSVSQEVKTLYQVLQEFGKKFSLKFDRVNNQIVVKKSAVLYPGTMNVHGTVCDASTNEPLTFASVMIDGTPQGTMTDANGNFSLVIAQDSSSLRCSYVGYKTLTVALSGQKDVSMTIRMISMDVLLQDVTIYAYQEGEKELANGNALSLQSEKIKSSTSIFPDVLRSVQMLPGVSTNNEFSAKFNVRGGNPDENLVLVNGTQVYDPYHLKELPNYCSGIFNTELIRKMDLMTGGFPARYGDKLSSVLNIEYREGDKERLKGTVGLSLTDVDILAEGPLGENGSFIVGGRKTYLEYILKMASPKTNVFPTFYDIQGVVNYSFNPNNKLLFKFIHAGDNLAEDPVAKRDGPNQFYSTSDNFTHRYQTDDSSDFRFEYYSTLLALQYVNLISSSTIWKTELSYYDQRESEQARSEHYYHSLIEGRGYFFFYDYTSKQRYHNTLLVRTMEVNSTLDQQLSTYDWIKTGGSYQHITYQEDQTLQRTIDKFGNFDFDHNDFGNYPDTNASHQNDNPYDALNNQMNTVSFKIGGYIENVVQLTSRLLLNIGGRADYFDLNKELTWSPRLNIAYQIMAGLTLRGAWGYYYQSPNYRQVAYPAASDTNTQSQRAVHYVLGTDYTVFLDSHERRFLKMKVEGYYKKYDNLMSAIQTSAGYTYYSRKNDAVGESKGVDVYLMCSLPGFYGWVSYSYLEAMQDNLHDQYGSFPRNADQRHTLALVGDLDLGSEWNMAVRYTYGSGYPFTPQSAQYITTTYQWVWSSGAPNSERLPSYRCMDVRMTKSFEMFGLATSAFLDVSNVLMAKNIITYQYYIDDNQPTKDGVNLPPLIPSIGISVRF